MFQKLPLHEAHSLGSSTGVDVISHNTLLTFHLDVTNNPYIQYKVYDIPMAVPLDEFCKNHLDAMQRCGSLIYVIDAKATPYEKACEYFKFCVATILRVACVVLRK